MNAWIKEIDDYLAKKKEELEKLPPTNETLDALDYIEQLKKPPYLGYAVH